MQWRQVLGFEGVYDVSEYGDVRRVSKGRILRPLLQSDGRPYYHLSVRGRVTRHMGHRLVLEAFVGPGDGLWGLHADDDPTNNHISNLRWGTPAENSADRKRNHTFWNEFLLWQTACRNGHEFTPENTYMKPNRGTRNESRGCRECRRKQGRASYQRRVAAEAT